MNKIVLIGNGFDLAHGMKTSYSDFILWYFKEAEQIASKNDRIHNDDLITIKYRRGIIGENGYSSIKNILNSFANHNIEYTFKNSFFHIIVKVARQYNWVDIEAEYYTHLIALYKEFETNHASRRKHTLSKVKELNAGLLSLKEKLTDYLAIIEKEKSEVNPIIYGHFARITQSVGIEDDDDKLLVINFNYTSTVNNYANELYDYNTVVYIHGRLNDPKNPIIFGYGDEKDQFYEKIERTNENAFLNGFKSFYYSQTSNYQDISRIIEGDDYEVYIMGHSCGISDRVLLNSIFENERCKEIELFYHKRSDGSSDYFERTQEISRHFSPEGKNTMRNIIKPYSYSKPLSEKDS